MRFLLPSILVLCSAVCADTPASQELIVDLRNPTYKNGHLYTNEGGVIRGQDLRIQAKNIQYTRKEAQHLIEADEDLLIQYKGKVYVGSELIYDVNKQSGVIYDGKTFASYWYVGGEAIHLHADGNYSVDRAFITTCENQYRAWDIHTKSLDVVKSDLKTFKEPIFKYDLRWDSGLGPRISTRYRLYSWQDFAIYGRVEYRLKAGFGGALETEYKPTDSNIRFITRSYLAKDRLVTATEKMQRYRVQGDFCGKSVDTRTAMIVCWDKYSDVRMPNDFKSDDFEINASKKTVLYIRHREDNFLGCFRLRARANPFESIKQDLPTLYGTIRPIELGSSGIFSLSYAKASYLDFVYSNQLIAPLPSYRAPRIELKEKLSRAFRFGSTTVTPYLGGVGIFYGNSQSSTPKWLGLIAYGARAETRATRIYERYKHQIQPYAEFMGLSHPTVTADDHYIFSIQDGYDKINHLRLGARNLLFSRKWAGKEPLWTADLYANAFFIDRAIPELIPYGYLDLCWHLPSLNFSWQNAWNFREQTLQYSNARLLWTVNEHIAMSLEGRYRSRFDWRKADHENFILDVSRSQSELLLSPLSDRRIAFLTNLFIRFTPFWECRIQSHHGFFRTNERPYNEVKVDLFTWISTSLKLRLSFAHSADRGINSVGAQVYLVR